MVFGPLRFYKAFRGLEWQCAAFPALRIPLCERPQAVRGRHQGAGSGARLPSMSSTTSSSLPNSEILSWKENLTMLGQ